MCRAKGQGGRRCQCAWTTKAKAKHNQRRRENRAIRRAAVAWAELEGELDMAEQFAKMNPADVKQWLRDRGKNPDDFKTGFPSTAWPAAGASAPPPQGAPPAPPLAPAGPAPAPRAAGGRAGAGGAAVAGSAGVPAPQAPTSGWENEWWCDPSLKAQIQSVVDAQGVHRDERSLLAGVPEQVVQAAGGTNETSRVTLDNGLVGYHKPFADLNDSLASGFGQAVAEQPVHEAAAWQLASQMGPPYDAMVPPVVLREVNGKLGSFALERPGKQMRRDVEVSPEWREAAFFDALIGQQDRHPNNYLMAGDRLTLIDHGYTFARPGDYCNWSWFVQRRHADSPDLTYQEREVLQRVVSSPDLMGMRSVLSPDRADALKVRAERMLRDGTIANDY